jgi:hypothetical protein
MRQHRVAHLLMGGQACVLYGAAEFSRDLDLAILPDPDNLDRLRGALADLEAEVVAVPLFRREHLDEGLAVHFRCRHSEAKGLRIDVMTRMRGVEPFPRLWARRTTFDFDDETLEVLSLPDLVAAKKTQRDKDWPMVRRLLDMNFLTHKQEPTPERVDFWLRELRTPELLVEVAERYPKAVAEARLGRPLLDHARAEALERGDLARALRAEEDAVRTEDEAYWRPLKRELSRMRRERKRPE